MAASKHPCEVHVHAPPEAEARHLCLPHYEAWRDGPREGPARVVLAELGACSKRCEACTASAGGSIRSRRGG